MADDLKLPLSALRPVELHKLREPGLVFPIDASRPLMAFTIWEERPKGIFLTGTNAFKFFPIEEETRGLGLFLPSPDIVVSTASGSSRERLWDQHGALLLQEGKAHILASRADYHWADPVAIPLWQSVDMASTGKAIGFCRWSIRFTDGTEQRTVWRFDGQEPAK